jgi:hypothetical protein
MRTKQAILLWETCFYCIRQDPGRNWLLAILLQEVIDPVVEKTTENKTSEQKWDFGHDLLLFAKDMRGVLIRDRLLALPILWSSLLSEFAARGAGFTRRSSRRGRD